MLVQISRTSTPYYVPQEPIFNGCVVHTVINPLTEKEEYFQTYEASESELLFLHRKVDCEVIILDPCVEAKNLGCELNLEIYDYYRE